jgi:chaperonin GroES
MKIERNNIQPVGEFVLLEMDPMNTSVVDGIFLNAPELPTEGRVIRLGTGTVQKDGRTLPFQVSVGDRVMIEKSSGTYAKLDNNLKLVRESDIIVIRK